MKDDGALDRYTLRRLVRESGERLKVAGVASPEHDARELAEWILGTQLPLVDGADEAFAATYEKAVQRRAAREPLQRITGRMFFRGLELECRPGVFIVRPETEVVAGVAIEAVLARERGGVAGGPLVVDLCTGSGAIAAAVAAEVPAARVIAVELADDAVVVAVAACERYAPGRVRVVQAAAAAPSTLANLDGTVDVVVTNPPSVPAGAPDAADTAPYHPPLARFGGGEDGLDLPVAPARRPGALTPARGLLLMQHAA